MTFLSIKFNRFLFLTFSVLLITAGGDLFELSLILKNKNFNIKFIRNLSIILSILGWGLIFYFLLIKQKNIYNQIIIIFSAACIISSIIVKHGYVKIEYSFYLKLIGLIILTFAGSYGKTYLQLIVIIFSKMGIFISDEVILPIQKKYNIVYGPGMSIRFLSWLIFAFEHSVLL